MESQPFNWTTASGKSISGYHWALPEAEQVVVLSHGFGEYMGRYDGLADYFREHHQSAVLGNDRLGHGRSEGLRGHVPEFDQFLDEIEFLLDKAASLYPGKPVLLYGHSMGGMLVLRYALKRPLHQVGGVVSSSPWLRLAFDPPAWKVALGKLMRNIWPSLQQPSGMDVDGLCSDPAVIKAYEEDPLVHGLITPSTGLGMMEGGEELLAHSEGLPVPTLIMHGLEDPVTSAQASCLFAEQNDNVSFKGWPGLLHEIHHEPGYRDILAFAGRWFEQVKCGRTA